MQRHPYKVQGITPPSYFGMRIADLESIGRLDWCLNKNAAGKITPGQRMISIRNPQSEFRN